MSTITHFRYKNIFLYASLQFCGNIEEYFSQHTEKLIVFIIMPRVQSKYNLIRRYSKGKLEEEVKVHSSENILMYYLYWYIYHLQVISKYFSRKERIVVISFHPLTFFFMTLQQKVRKLQFVYWIGDYFPSINFSLSLYEKIKKFYHDRVIFSCYLSNKINQKMNGKVLSTKKRKTVMWGVKPLKIERKNDFSLFTLLFIGLIKPSQGLEETFLFLKSHNQYRIKILGVCEKNLYEKYKKLIKHYNIEKRVFFPNKFFSESEVVQHSLDAHVGIGLYDISPNNATHYADPGKIKTYAELGLPIIMSNISDVVYYIKKFQCGEVINEDNSLENALVKIKKDYKKYSNGLKKFNEYFYYEDYYRSKFTFLETI